ncbi:MAG: hypothetical protein DRP45_08325 [Candidatus Zixiibacteriota bacterium]|nr:MAG: hypothetical protein DRP45_08325 [candidate division Zixibacteria bacterium]
MISKNLIARLAVAAVAIPAILWTCYQGGEWLLGMVILFAVIGLLEFLHREGYSPRNVLFWLSLATVLSALVGIRAAAGLVSPVIGTETWFPVVIPIMSVFVFYFLSAMMSAIGTASPEMLFQRHSRLFWGVTYIGVLYPFVYLVGDSLPSAVSNGPSGGDHLLFLFGLLWVGDTAAMGIGKWLGSHKLAPAVSPNKTVEGFIGGIVGALAIGVLMIFWKFSAVPWYHVLVIAVGCSVFGQLGDLVESMWKRSLGIKDSSAIIPGHGGVLDRFDSLLFAAPFMYVYVTLFMCP